MAVLCLAPAVVAEDARSLMQAAKDKYDQGEISAALTGFAQLGARFPQSFEAQQAAYYQARCLEQLGRRSEAQQQYRQFITTYPESYLRSTAERRIAELAGGSSTPAPVVPSPSRPAPVPAVSSRPAAAPAAPAPAAPAVAAAPVELPAEHTVRSGESVSGLCLRYYGSAAHWREVAYHNRLADPARIAVGQVLKFPEPSVLAGLTAAAQAQYAQPRPADTVPVAVAVETAVVVPAAPQAPTETEQLALLMQRWEEIIAAGTDAAAVEEAHLGLARLAYAAGDAPRALQQYELAAQVRPGSGRWFTAMYQAAALQVSVRHDPVAARTTLVQLLAALPATGQEPMRASATALLAAIAGTPEQAGEQEMMAGPVTGAIPAPPTLTVNIIEVEPAVRPVAAAPSAAGAPAAPVPAVAPAPVVDGSETAPVMPGFTDEDMRPLEVIAYVPAPGTAPAETGAAAPVPVVPAPPVAPPPVRAPAPAVTAETTADATTRTLRVQELLREALDLKQRGMPSEAAQVYRAALQLDPANPEVLNNLAYLYADLGVHLDEAETMTRAAMRADALREGYYRDTLGWVLYRKGNYAAARDELQRALAYRETAERHYHLGVTYRALGMQDDAIRHLMTARTLAGGGTLAAEITRHLAELQAPPAR